MALTALEKAMKRRAAAEAEGRTMRQAPTNSVWKQHEFGKARTAILQRTPLSTKEKGVDEDRCFCDATPDPCEYHEARWIEMYGPNWRVYVPFNWGFPKKDR